MTNLWPVVESTVWRNCQVIWCWGQNIFTCISVEINQLNIQWNPDFLNPQFLKPHDNSNQKSFPLDLLHSNTVILPPISWTLDNSKLPQTRTNSWLLWEKLTLDNSNLWKFRNHLSADFSYIRTLKQINTSGQVVFSIFITQQATNLSSVTGNTMLLLHNRGPRIKWSKVPLFSCFFEAVVVIHWWILLSPWNEECRALACLSHPQGWQLSLSW